MNQTLSRLLPRGGNVAEGLYGDWAPFYHLCPKNPAANAEYRRALWRLASESIEVQQILAAMCFRDPLFYINSFVVTYDPRKEAAPGQLFITYPFQDLAFKAYDDAIGKYNLPTEKSRDMGASWMIMTIFEWRWHFKALQSFLAVSRKEDLVDKSGDPKSLFWKIDFIHKHLPDWLMPSTNRMKLHLANLDNGSTIDGESTTGDVGRGDRRTAILLDEFAAVKDGYTVLRAVHDATDCVLQNSTPRGVGNAFYTSIEKASLKLRLHWSSHPEKAAGLYRSTGGVLEIVDVGYMFPAEYPFIRDGKVRSPWYDSECRRRVHPVEIATELDIDYQSSDFQYFDTLMIENLKLTTGMIPFLEGTLDFDEQTFEHIAFREHENGPLKLWVYPNEAGDIPDGDYSMGVDVAEGPVGSEASNTVFSIADRNTGAKVAEFVVQGVPAHKTAGMAIALAKWFNNAFMIWEANGPGRIFGDNVLESGYLRIYYRKNDKTITKKVSDVPGWYSGRDEKRALLGHYMKTLNTGTYLNRSVMALGECLYYVYLLSGGIEHVKSVSSENPTEKGDNHGDRVIADALCAKIMLEGVFIKKGGDPEILQGSLAWRIREHAHKHRQALLW